MSFTNWADAGTELPAPQVIDNNDGTKTVISYRYNDQKKKIKVTQKIKLIETTETVNPLVAKRMKWSRFGLEKDNKNIGPATTTTKILEPVTLILSTTWKADEEKEQQLAKKNTARSVMKCRFCGNSGHYSAKCPYKDTFGVDGLPKSEVPAASDKPSGFGAKYVPSGLRAGANGLKPVNEVPALRFTNLNSNVDTQTLQQLVSKFGPYERVSVLRNRDTGEPMGVAFVNMLTKKDAEAVMEGLNGKGLFNMIISVEWAKPKK